MLKKTYFVYALLLTLYLAGASRQGWIIGDSLSLTAERPGGTQHK